MGGLMSRKFISAAMAFLFLTGFLPVADVIPGKWQKVDLLPAGSPITIKTIYGEQVPCTYFGSDRETLLIVETRRNQRRIRKAEIETIIAEKYDDRLVNGAVIGLSAGVAFALLLSLARGETSHHDRVTLAVFGSVLFGLCGMGVGTLVDYQHQGREVVYRAAKNHQ
jgi:hypothetical protein